MQTFYMDANWSPGFQVCGFEFTHFTLHLQYNNLVMTQKASGRWSNWLSPCHPCEMLRKSWLWPGSVLIMEYM